MEYNQLLDKLYKEVKPILSTGERFEIPRVEGRVEGNKTIVTNFIKICSALRREPAHLLKFLQRELAAPAIIEGESLILTRKVTSIKINEKIAEYTKEFVICPECKKPDTQLLKQDKFVFLKCLACGAKHSVRAKIN